MDGRLSTISREAPVLVAGCTAAGKSALAMDLAARDGRTVVNADALQVWSCWRVLTARPSAADEAAVPHALYGHLAPGDAASAGDWLRAVAPWLDRPVVIVGGTGLHFAALTQGMAAIPPVPAAVRAEADARRVAGDVAGMLTELDPATRARIDIANPARVQRAWEVLRATGRGLAAWQAETGPPLLPQGAAERLVVALPTGVLNARIAARFDAMLAGGALDEVAAVRPMWQPAAPWARAIGAAGLMAHLQGHLALAEARAAAVTATQQYAKRQRTWFRARMADWRAWAG
jgi:tRNA dimethylallyltransferase